MSAAKRADLPSITRLYKALYMGDEHMRFYRSRVRLDGLKSGQKIFIAKAKGEAAGFLWLIWYEHMRHKGVACIEELFVKPGFRQRGLGRALVSNAMRFSKKKGMLVVFVVTGRHMIRAQRFYKKAGFHHMTRGCFVRNLNGNA